MTEPAVPHGRIFISYRREETAYPAGWLFDRLTEHFGRGNVFKDVDSIKLGDDFAQKISEAVESCDTLLALVGKQWLTIIDENGQRRIDNPKDFVRLEIETALAHNVRVVPVLVDKATMPCVDDLPPSLVGLAHRHALELSSDQFDRDVSRLLGLLTTNWQVDLISRSKIEAVFRLYSGTRQHFIKFTNYLLLGGHILVDGKPALKETLDPFEFMPGGGGKTEIEFLILDEYGQIRVNFKFAKGSKSMFAEFLLREVSLGHARWKGPVRIAVNGVVVYED